MRLQNRGMLTLLSTALILSGMGVSAQQPEAAQPTKGYTAPAAPAAVHPANEGQRIFEQNCSRCHATPEGFRPSISGTVVRHMRVRASLSEHDEKELLRFFNP